VDAGLTTSTRLYSEPPQFGLRWPWLALTLLVALSAWWMQRVVSAADYANRANAMWRSGSPTMTLQFGARCREQQSIERTLEDSASFTA
jgi:hypothetical protein